MNLWLRTCIRFVALTFITGEIALSQVPVSHPVAFQIQSGATVPLLPSNSITHLVAQDAVVWIGSGKGLARSSNSGRTWESFAAVSQFATTSIFSLVIRGDTIWASTGYVKDVSGSSVQTGSGYTYSTDNGATWNAAGQTMDGRYDTTASYGTNTIHFLPVVVPEQNVTFSSALTSNTVWIASWSSGIRSSTDMGHTWKRAVLPAYGLSRISPSDSLGAYLVNPLNDYNFLGFSVFAENDSVIWAGTAGGINKSTDRGLSWTRMDFTNQVSHILGNWVTAIAAQPRTGSARIWAVSWTTNIEGEQYGVNATDDGGRTWKTFLPGIKSYQFAFKDSIVYVASDNGLFRSSDGGESWTASGSIVDASNGNQLATTVFYSVGVIGDTIYGGTADGFVKTIDNAAHAFGSSWRCSAHVPVGSVSSSYAYPNPFSPRSEITRVHYNSGPQGGTVTVELFDFGMNRVRTIAKDASRPSGEHDELWDGTTDSGKLAPNGVYFYRVIVNGGNPAWGKIMVIQ